MDQSDAAKNGSSNAAGEANRLASPIAYDRYAVKRALDTGPVVVPKVACALDDVSDLRLRDLVFRKPNVAVREASFGRASEIENNFDE